MEQIGHQLEHLFVRLKQFLNSLPLRNRAAAESLMKYDYFMGQRHRPRKVWWDHPIEKRELGHWMRKVALEPQVISASFAEKGWGERELHKHAVAEIVAIDPVRFAEAGELVEEPTLLIVCYDPAAKAPAESYAAPLASLEGAAPIRLLIKN